MFGPCMCGDTCCNSCGPAQGNWRCPICDEWASECCDHIDEGTGQLKPMYQPQADEVARLQRENEEALARFMLDCTDPHNGENLP